MAKELFKRPGFKVRGVKDFLFKRVMGIYARKSVSLERNTTERYYEH